MTQIMLVYLSSCGSCASLPLNVQTETSNAHTFSVSIHNKQTYACYCLPSGALVLSMNETLNVLVL